MIENKENMSKGSADRQKINIIVSVKNAWRGLKVSATKESHFVVHLFAAVWILLLLYTGRAAAWQYIAAVVCIALVAVSEIVNTAIEMLCDKICPAEDSVIRDIKDAAAGAVLLSSVAAVAVAVIMLWSKDFWAAVLSTVWEHGWTAVFLVTLPIAAALLLFPKKRKSGDAMRDEPAGKPENEKDNEI